MYIQAKIIYGFRLPQEYNELKQFEAEHDISKMRKSEDTVATRYIYTINTAYPYKSKEEQTDCAWGKSDDD